MGSFPPTAIRLQKTYYTLAHRSNGGPFVVTGPYVCTRSPISGDVAVSMQTGGDQTTVDERVYMPLDAQPASTDILRNMTTGEATEIVYVQRWPGKHVECYVRRAMTETNA